MQTYYCKEPSMVARKIAGETVIVPIRQSVGDLNCLYTLNPTAGRIWDMLDDHVSFEEIVAVLTQEYEVETTQAESDVREFLGQMKDISAILEKTD